MAKYWAFLSYSHQDNLVKRKDSVAAHYRWAEWLHEALENWHVPAEFKQRRLPGDVAMPERFFPVFQDEKELPLNADLAGSIRTALEESRFLIVICSPRSAKSFYVNEEVRYFKELGRQPSILALIVDGEPNASEGGKTGFSPDEECFCPALRHPLKADATLDLSKRDAQEPIAGDVRLMTEGPPRELLANEVGHHHDVLDYMKLKLLAGLMHVGFDELAQRDKARQLREAAARNRRLWALVALFATIALIAVGAGVAAFLSRQEADRQRQTANEQRQEAEARKAEADDQRKVAQSETEEAVKQKKKALSLLVTGYLQQASGYFNPPGIKLSPPLDSGAEGGSYANNACLSDRTLSLALFESWREGLAYLAASARADPTDPRPENAIVQILSCWNWPLLQRTQALAYDNVTGLNWTTVPGCLSLATHTADGPAITVHLNIETGATVPDAQAGQPVPGHAEKAETPGNFFQGMLSPDGKTLAVVHCTPGMEHESWNAYDCTLQIYQLRPAAPTEPVAEDTPTGDGHYRWVDRSLSGRQFVSVRTASGAREIADVPLPEGADDAFDIVVDPEVRYIAVAYSTGLNGPKDRAGSHMVLWDAKAGRQLWTYDVGPGTDLTSMELDAPADLILIGTKKTVDYVDTVRGVVLDKATGRDVTPMLSDGSAPSAVVAVPNSTRLVLTGPPGLEAIDWTSPARKKHLADGPASDLLPSPDGRLVACSVPLKNSTFVVPVDGKNPARPIKGQLTESVPFWFNPDGSHLMTEDDDTMSDRETYRLYDTTNGAPVSDPIELVERGEVTPDQNWFVFQESDSGEGGTYTLTLRDADAGGGVFRVPLFCSENPPFESVTLSCPDAEKVLDTGDTDTAKGKILHLHFYAAPTPSWLADLADAAAGLKLDTHGELTESTDVPHQLAALNRAVSADEVSELDGWGLDYLKGIGAMASANVSTSPPPTSPTAANPPTSAPASGQVDLAKFIRDFLDASNSGSTDSEITYYASEVNYYDNGQRDTAFIRTDISKYNGTWPTRHFAVRGEPVVETIDAANWRVTCEIDFIVSNPTTGTARNGSLTDVIEVRNDNGCLEITSIQSK